VKRRVLYNWSLITTYRTDVSTLLLTNTSQNTLGVFRLLGPTPEIYIFLLQGFTPHKNTSTRYLILMRLPLVPSY
jgi:hypothetical protein